MKSISRSLFLLFLCVMPTLTPLALADEPVPTGAPSNTVKAKAASDTATQDPGQAEAKKYTDAIQAYYDAAQT